MRIRNLSSLWECENQMTKSIATLQDLQKIDPTIQEINNPHKEIPNISEDDDSRTVICVVVFVYNNVYCKTMVNTKRGGFAWIYGTSFLDNDYTGHDLCIESKSKIGLMKSEYELYNLYNTRMCGPCKFFVCDTNKAKKIVKFIYYGRDTHYGKITTYALFICMVCISTF